MLLKKLIYGLTWNFIWIILLILPLCYTLNQLQLSPQLQLF